MLTDTRIIHSHGGYDVLAHRQVVTWPNGSTIGLHPVRFQGYDDMFLRATAVDELHFVVFDLRKITPPGYEADVKVMPERDREGMALYALRLHHANAEAAQRAILSNAHAAWFLAEPAVAA